MAARFWEKDKDFEQQLKKKNQILNYGFPISQFWGFDIYLTSIRFLYIYKIGIITENLQYCCEY